MRSHTLYADALQPGDDIIGDEKYPRGLLDLRVTEVTKTRSDDGTTVTIKVESGSDYAIVGTITYDGDDSVTVASLPASDPFDGITDLKTNDPWDAS